jgi:uncharacterized protein
MTPETRISTDLRIEQRADRPGRRITGYAAVFDSEAEIAGAFRERIAPGAFKRALGEGQDTICVVNHNPDRLLGRTRSGTLELSEDSRGLWFSVDPPDTQEGREIITLLERGDLSGASFAFRAAKDGEHWDHRAKGLPLRTLTDVDLFDVSIVVTPAYADASAALRSLAAAGAAARREVLEAKLAARLAKLGTS